VADCYRDEFSIMWELAERWRWNKKLNKWESDGKTSRQSPLDA
jgi:hypothetical protein